MEFQTCPNTKETLIGGTKHKGRLCVLLCPGPFVSLLWFVQAWPNICQPDTEKCQQDRTKPKPSGQVVLTLIVIPFCCHGVKGQEVTWHQQA